jgi:hypothetical protein
MVAEGIEKLKQQYTDKFVVVNASVPELARFRDFVGLVKTVNMNGRALVEFDHYNNVGWYDIDLGFLKVVPKPEPKLAEAKHKAAEKAATMPGTEKVTAPAAKMPAAAATSPAASKQSTADILAAARAKKGTALGAAPATTPAPAAKPAATGKPSTADILAAARGKAAPAAIAPAAKKVEPKPAPEEPAEDPVAEAVPEAPAAKVEPLKKPAAGGGPKPTTTAEKIAYCRRVDAKA